MKTISSGLNTHIQQEVTTLARCWKLVRTDGTILRFTSSDVDITILGDGTYSSSTGFKNTATESKSDLSVDNLELLGVFDDEAITINDLRAGLYDFADLYIFLVNWQDTTQGKLRLRRGKLGEVIASPQGWFNVEVRGLTQFFAITVVERYGAACRADLFDARCGLDKTNWLCTGHVIAVTDATHVTIQLDTTGSSYLSNDNYFQYGELQWSSGQNNGRSVEIKTWNHTANTIELYVPTGYPIAVNDTFSAVPGCDKSLATCRDKFANLVNRRGEGYLPGNDKVFWYPDVGSSG